MPQEHILNELGTRYFLILLKDNQSMATLRPCNVGTCEGPLNFSRTAVL